MIIQNLKINSFVLACLFLLSACGGAKIISGEGKMEIYEVTKEDRTYYFYYPSSAVVDDGRMVIGGNCAIMFGFDFSLQLAALGLQNVELDLEKKVDDDVTYEAWYEENELKVYRAYIDVDDLVSNEDPYYPGFDLHYVFAMSDYNPNVNFAECMGYVDAMAESFTDKPMYTNDRFGFSIELPVDFKIENMPSSEGVYLKKWIEEGGYVVEIGVLGQENVMEWANLADFIDSKYSGYTMEFASYDGVSGVYIDEGAGDDAVRHFFVLNEGAHTLYEAYLKVPSMKFASHIGELEVVARTMKLF